ncbi:GDSL-type esterase/lipase family protein [Longitalea luteola]|uniref:GDSL-type esterase/lipase family protein n=1 Tax=Longitalea luteola TaxID=2812563 RepID=UPI001F61C771|nr:GDSL-type esterase/lipase family protein [Longitalea luteola]
MVRSFTCRVPVTGCRSTKTVSRITVLRGISRLAIVPALMTRPNRNCRLSAAVSRFTFAVCRSTVLVLSTLASFAQEGSKKIDSNYNNAYYQGRMELFNTLTPPKNAIVFLGNSISERGAWSELLPGQPVMNRGIGGDNTFGVLARLEGVVKAKPKKIFLLIGINDLSRGLPKEVIINNYHRIIRYLTAFTPKTKIYLQSVLPLNEPMTTPAYLKNKKDSILQLNRGIKQVAEQYHLPYINLHDIFADANGDLKKELTMDGIHLRPAAYVLWVDFLKKKNYL